MKFHLAINIERMNANQSMAEIEKHTLEMVQMAERGGFEIVWAAEHHALEMTVAPNPFLILARWAENTNSIRLGTAVAVAAYWHPIRLAGEAAFIDLISGGRLEFGIGSGAYQREFDRLKNGLKQSDAWLYMQEMVPALQALWQEDYAHDGEYWKFPLSTSVPKPLQKPYPPIWVAARAPITFDYAVKNGFNIMSWPITKPMSEVALYCDRLSEALQANSGCKRPTFAMMRHTAVYDRKDEWMVPIQAAQNQLSQFENLFKNLGDVENGFPKGIPLDELQNRSEYEAQMLSENMMFGTPDEVIKKLTLYQEAGVDSFIYYASMGLGLKEQKRSMDLFCKEVLPVFK